MIALCSARVSREAAERLPARAAYAAARASPTATDALLSAERTSDRPRLPEREEARWARAARLAPLRSLPIFESRLKTAPADPRLGVEKLER